MQFLEDMQSRRERCEREDRARENDIRVGKRDEDRRLRFEKMQPMLHMILGRTLSPFEKPCEEGFEATDSYELNSKSNPAEEKMEVAPESVCETDKSIVAIGQKGAAESSEPAQRKDRAQPAESRTNDQKRKYASPIRTNTSVRTDLISS